MNERIDPRTFMALQIVDALEPLPDRRGNIHDSMLLAMTANAHRGEKGEAVSANAFLLSPDKLPESGQKTGSWEAGGWTAVT